MTTALKFRNIDASRLAHPYGTTELLEGVVARACKLAADSEQEDEGIRGPGPRHQVWAVQAGVRGENRHLAVSPVDLHVREGRALRNLDGADATASPSRLRED